VKYADVVIDTKSDSIDNFFTYEVGELRGVRVGSKVSVPFAQEKAKRAGYVFGLKDELPPELVGKRIRKIEAIDETASISGEAIEICRWMRRRCYCRYIDAVRCFAPAGKALKKKAADAEADGGETDDSEIAKNNEKTSQIKSEKESVNAEPPALTQEQKKALALVEPALESGISKVFLLRGVTGSGKTEVYLAAAKKAVSLGKKAIMLVPEISLTHQTVERFIARFGREKVAVLHSALTLRERYDEWMRIKNGSVDIVIGARSAVFAPLANIGIIIVDEEHESTYKSDMTPKYDAIEVAVKRAGASKAVCLLGSATPSVVSTYRAERGFYEQILLTKRYNATPLPHLTMVDMRKELMNGNKSIFSEELYAAMLDAFSQGQQALLFLNRRGWSSFVSCPHCGYAMKCDTCKISLTYHKAENAAVCHFCGAKKPIPDTCPTCGAENLRFFGLGTEQVEELTKKAFPDRRVARLDVDAAKPRGATKKILDDFAKGKTDILIGTQMVAKGLDFEKVAVVGAISADLTLNIPDFKSPERTFQLITQVAGRAGRREERGKVFVQTYVPENYALEAARNHDYEGFYRAELFFRETLLYPPFSDIIQISAYAQADEVASAGAEFAREWIIKTLGDGERARLLGPKPAPVAKIGKDFRYHLYIKAPTARRKVYEKALFELKQKINTDPKAAYRIIIDVNPFSLM